MHKIIPAVSATLLIAGAQTGSAQQSSSSDVFEALNRVFAAWNDLAGPGCAVGVSQYGEIVLQQGYGMANLEHDIPITPSSIFHVASVSKQFTAAAVMLLARDGKLSLDDDVRRYLPELPDYGHTITVRHLLAHTSGLRDQWDLLHMARGRFEENRITEEDVLEIVTRQRALNFDPGTEYLYSNSGYTLAAVIVRRVSGKSLREFAHERIFAPLGMTDTHFHDDYTMVVRGRAAGYRPGNGGAWHVNLPNYDTYGATSLFTTVGDLLKWDANFEQLRVGDEAMFREMQTGATLVNGETTGYGLGIALDTYRGARLVGHGGADAGYRTYLGRMPDFGLTVAVLCNAASANPASLARAVADAYLGERLEPAGELVSSRPPQAGSRRQQLPRLSPAQLAAYAGTYYSEELGATYTVEVRDGALEVSTRWGAPRTVSPTGNDTFAGDFLLTFTRSERGGVDGMLMSTRRVRGVRFERVP